MTWQGEAFPSVDLRFVCPHPVLSQPSPASWRLASRLTGPCQGQLFPAGLASTPRDAPRARGLPAQAMEIASYALIMLRGARFPASQSHTGRSPCGDTGLTIEGLARLENDEVTLLNL